MANPNTQEVDESQRLKAGSVEKVILDELLPNPDAELSEKDRLDLDRKLVRKLDWKIIPWLSLLYLISFLDRANIGNARIYGLQENIGHISDTQYNIGLTVFFISYSVVEPLTNILLKKLRPKIFIPLIMITWAVCLISMGLVSNFKGLVTARFFLGLTEAGLFPGVNYYLSCWYKRSELGVRIAVFFSAAAFAGSFGGLLAAAIALMDGVGGKPGWAWIFILEGLATILIGIFSYWMVHDFPDEVKFLTPSERLRALRRLREDEQASGRHEELKSIFVWQALKDWKTYLYMTIYAGSAGSLYAFSLFLPSIIKELGYTSSKANATRLMMISSMVLDSRENPGSAADASQAEAEAVRELVDVVSKGRSEENYRKHHRFWKFLHDVRVEGTNNEMEDAEARMLKDGLTHILLFRTKRFNRRFFNKTKDSLQTVRKWNQVYHPYLKEVQMRVLAERANDFSGSTDWHQAVVRNASNVSKVASINWVSGTRALNREEQQSYLASFDSTLRPEELSLQNTADVLRDGVDGQSERNNAIYICLVPYEGPPNGKRTHDGTPASRVVAAPCPVIPILPGDFLGVMSGQLRYTPELGCSDKAIQGPDPKLWLDFSKITGKLSCMRSADSGTEANVTLTWKRYNDQHGINWRIEVVATKEIWPFEELVRPNSDPMRSHF